MTRCTAHHRSAFSLPELLVVIGIMMILLGLFAPAVTSARRSAQAVRCRAQLHQIGQAIAAYSSSHRGRIIPFHPQIPPWESPWWELLSDSDSQFLICPLGLESPHSPMLKSYMLNFWLRFYDARLGQKLRPTTPSQTVLGGEVIPNLPPPQYFHPPTGVEHLQRASYRHGRTLRSNYLWLDFHVSNEPPPHRPGTPDSWWAIPMD